MDYKKLIEDIEALKIILNPNAKATVHNAVYGLLARIDELERENEWVEISLVLPDNFEREVLLKDKDGKHTVCVYDGTKFEPTIHADIFYWKEEEQTHWKYL